MSIAIHHTGTPFSRYLSRFLCKDTNHISQLLWSIENVRDIDETMLLAESFVRVPSAKSLRSLRRSKGCASAVAGHFSKDESFAT